MEKLQIPEFDNYDIRGKQLQIPKFNTPKERKESFAPLLIGIGIITLTYAISTQIMPDKVAEPTPNNYTAQLKAVDGRVATFNTGENTLVLEIPQEAANTINIETDYKLTLDEGRVISILPK